MSQLALTLKVPFADQCRGVFNSYQNNTVVSGTAQFYGSCAFYNLSDPVDHVNIDLSQPQH